MIIVYHILIRQNGLTFPYANGNTYNFDIKLSEEIIYPKRFIDYDNYDIFFQKGVCLYIISIWVLNYSSLFFWTVF